MIQFDLFMVDLLGFQSAEMFLKKMETIYLAFFERDPLSADNDVEKCSTHRMNEDGFGKKKKIFFHFLGWGGCLQKTIKQSFIFGRMASKFV